MLKLAVLDDYSAVAMNMADWDSLAGVTVTVFHDHLADEDALTERLQPFDIICLMRERTPMPRSLIGRLDNLRMIASTGYHNPSIDLDAAKERGIMVTGTPRISNSTAELVMCLMLCMARNIVPQVDLIRAGGWEYGIGRCIGGAKLGIVGLGNVGKRVARLGASVGMNVIAWSQNLTPELALAGGAAHVTKDTLFQQADFVSIHLKLSERTRNIVGAHEFALMKPDSYLINTARAANVDMVALLDALSVGQIAGAAVDIFDEEPLPSDHPYRTTPNLIVTPHLGYVTRESMGNFYGDVVEAVHAFLEGREAPIRLA
jgi:phosphoglycerate dehydrogenase-like enzyme